MAVRFGYAVGTKFRARNLLRRLPAVLILLLLFVPFQPQLNQPSN